MLTSTDKFIRSKQIFRFLGQVRQWKLVPCVAMRMFDLHAVIKFIQPTKIVNQLPEKKCALSTTLPVDDRV